MGAYPYRMRLSEQGVADDGKVLSFNVVGDTGGVKSPVFQTQIAWQMGQQLSEDPEASQFLYHLGDIVYHFGEREQYEAQFFTPYSAYQAPIFAIPGNHDADVNPDNPKPYRSLDPFVSVFCDQREGDHYFSPTVTRRNQRQPNVYWTLDTELATIIGLYSNVPKFGFIDKAQRAWFIEELKRAGTLSKDKAIIVCVHHSPYSADTNHGSSLRLIEFFDRAFTEAGTWPDVVFSGHVHNYQRFTKVYEGGKKVPFIVAGAGGFDELHDVAMKDDPSYPSSHPFLNEVKLEKYAVYHHGFLKVVVKKTESSFTLRTKFYQMAHEEKDLPIPVSIYDTMEVDLNKRS